MPTEFGDAIQSPTPTGKTEFGDAAAGPGPTDQEKGGYFHELYRQLIADPIKAFKADPIGTLTHLIGGAGGMITGTTPVPGPGGQIQVSGPTQMAGVADIAERGPAAIGAATTLAALPIATRFAAPLVASGVGKAVNAATTPGVADLAGVVSPRVGNMLRVAGRVKRGVEAFQKAGEEAPGVVSAPTEDMATLDGIARSQTGKPFEKLDAGAQATVRDIAQRINSGAAPEAATSVNRPGPQLVLPRKFPPKNIRDIAQQELGQGNPPSGQDIIRGSSNIPLSEQGQAEAQRLAQATAGQFDKIYTSPLDRAQVTAKTVAATNPQAGAPEPTEALTPWYLGAHEGQPTQTVLAKMQDLIQNHPDEVPAGRGPQSTKPGQSFNDFKDEFLSHVQNQVENYEPGQKILNATHYRDTRVLQAWAKAGASNDFKVDVPTMLEKGEVKPGDMLHLNPQTMAVKAVDNANEPGIYFARHGATAWNAENGTPNPAESVGAPGPAGGTVPQPPAAEVARLNAGAPPAAPQGGGMFLRNYDLDKIARTIRTQVNKGSITPAQAQQIMESQAGVENLRDQLGLKGRYQPAMSDYLARKVDLTQPEQGQAAAPTIQQVISSRLQGWPGVQPEPVPSPIGTRLTIAARRPTAPAPQAITPEAVPIPEQSLQSTAERPSLGTTGRDIYQGWKTLAGSPPPRAIIEGYVPGLGRFDFRGEQIVRLEKLPGKRGSVVSTYTPATDAEIQGIHDAIDRGQFQVEQRTISGAGGVRQFQNAGALEKVFHQATGRPLAEFLATPEGKAWAKRVGYNE